MSRFCELLIDDFVESFFVSGELFWMGSVYFWEDIHGDDLVFDVVVFGRFCFWKKIFSLGLDGISSVDEL